MVSEPRRSRTRLFVSVVSAAAALTLVAPAGASIWPTQHARIADALTNGDDSERRTAAAKLDELPPKLARVLAKKALSDPDLEVRLSAARAAATLGVEGGGDEVVSWLQDPDVKLRVAACELIEASPTPQSVQALARLLGDGKPQVRRAAASAMGASGMSDSVSPLLGHLDDGSPSVRLEVVRALGRIGDGRAVVPLVSRLQDQSSDVRRETARALGQLGDQRATASLMLTLQDKSMSVRVQALDALGKLRSADAVVAIAAVLAPEGGVPTGADLARGPLHDSALRALGRIGTTESVALLIDALEGEGPVPLLKSRRAPVREALQLAGSAATAGLITALRGSPSRTQASAIALTLAALDAASAVKPIVVATRRGTVALDHGLIALGALDDEAALPFVLEQLDAGDSRIRKIVVRVATGLLDPAKKDGRPVDVVKTRVVDLRTPIGERIALVRMLGKTGSPKALPVLLTLKETKPKSLRVAVVKALGQLGVSSKEVDAALTDALEATSEPLRVAAAKSLARVGRDDAAAALVHRLGVSAEQDRAAIGLALSGALSRSTKPELVEAVGKALASAPGASRDALIEGLGRMRTDEARALLTKLASGTDVDDRRKVAEALAGHGAKGEAALVSLLADPDAGVRANAAWSLGHAGATASSAPLRKAVRDLDVAVAGNAALALARVTRRHAATQAAAVPALCEAVKDYRSYVRVGALTGLAELGKPCATGDTVRHVLRRDRSWRARLAAARLLQRLRNAKPVTTPATPATPASPATPATPATPASPAPSPASKPEKELNRRALARCAAEDRDAGVAALCATDPKASKATSQHEVLVYIVPDGKTAATPHAPFALVLADGSMRLGVADRRGAAFEALAPKGKLALAVPAALAR